MLRITILLTSMVTIQLTLKVTINIRILLKKTDSFCCGIAKGNHQKLQGLDALATFDGVPDGANVQLIALG